jgi:hypothetical protein
MNFWVRRSVLRLCSHGRVITLSSGLVFQRILVVKPQTLDQLVRIHKLRGGGDSYTRIVQLEEAIFALWVSIPWSRGYCLWRVAKPNDCSSMGMVGRRVEVTMMGAKPEEASQEPKLDLNQIA